VAILSAALALLATVVAARQADAHVVPIPPSLCRAATIDLALPAARIATSAAVPDGAAMLRFVYDANASVVHACATRGDAPADCDGGIPYPFELGGSSGSLALPARFAGLMESSGDVILDELPVALTLGAATASIPVTLTTGLVAAGGVVFEGVPLQGLGTWGLVGVVDGASLPPPLTGESMLLRVGCQPRPVPDRDQFVPPSVVGSLKGQIGPDVIRLRATVTIGPADRPSLSRGPVLLAIRVDGATIATAVVSAGLQGGGRRQVGASDDGGTIVTARGRSSRAVHLTIEVRGAPLPDALPARALVGLTIDTGTLLARGERLFRASAGGRALRR